MATLQERFAAALTARGEHEVPSRSSKYRTFTRQSKGTDGLPRTLFYFLGRNGALRVGRAVSDSLPCSDKFKASLLNMSIEELLGL